ncbi:hypothetical protein ACFFIR_09600, partial [Microbacterium arthrosphaerae]
MVIVASVLVAAQVMWGGAFVAPSAFGEDGSGTAGAVPWGLGSGAGTPGDDSSGEGSGEGSEDAETPAEEVPELLVPPATNPRDYSLVIVLPADPRRTAPAAPGNPYGPNCREVTTNDGSGSTSTTLVCGPGNGPGSGNGPQAPAIPAMPGLPTPPQPPAAPTAPAPPTGLPGIPTP